MSIARHHADWLSLIEVSGPFVSLPVVQRVFPHGLPDLEPGLISEVRAAYADWQENGGSAAATHQAWVQYVLQRVLGFPPELIASGQSLPPGLEAKVDTFHETLRPDFAILPPADREDRRPVLLVRVYPPQQRLESPLAGVVWKASPAARMMELLHATGLPLGLVTNGEEWQLVFAPKNETTGFASWYSDLWLQEPITLRAFQALLSRGRFFGVAEEDTPAAMLQASVKDQHEVTNSLGAQVRQAVELLVRDFDRLDVDSQRQLLTGLQPRQVYDASLTVMMRLVFLFCAEEKGLLRLGEAFYDTHYAVSTLREQLREIADQRGEEVLERRSDAWCRLLATFRAVHGGVAHDAMRLPAYGGTLFDPDRYPFLEGRAPGTHWRTTPSQPPHINNRVVLHLLEALQILRTKLPGGGPAEARRLSFRSLDIEQIGHVYEGLLDHTARRASSITLGLEGSAKAPAPLITLGDLETLATKGSEALLDHLEELTGRSRTALEKALGLRVAKPRGKKGAATAAVQGSTSLIPDPASQAEEHLLAVACGHDPHLIARVRPYAGLLRQDSFGQPVLIAEYSLHIAPSNDRRSSGTHYTPRSLTEPIVQHTLEPLVYIGPAEGKPQGEWQLRPPVELLALKVCDMAMGSGAFLVQTCRYLAERLVEAWEALEKAHPGQLLATPEGGLSTASVSERLVPTDPTERLAIARRYVADRCLYGVDINPMAVEMAKLSLWLITLQRDRPFTFLDHALKCGDSLLGVSKLEQIENFSLRPGDRQTTFATANLFRYIEEAGKKRRQLEDLPSNDHAQIETKNRLHAEAEAATAKVKAIADRLVALELRSLDGEPYEEQRIAEAEQVQLMMQRDADGRMEISNYDSELARAACENLRGRRTFHWPAEFPEVFDRGGFDAFIGNPPFMGGQLISLALGTNYRKYLIKILAAERRGSADYCAYFVLRSSVLLKSEGTAGLIATNTIAEGETRIVGLAQLPHFQIRLISAISSMPWPGQAALAVSILWMRKGEWNGAFVLDHITVTGLTSTLTPEQSADRLPKRLAENKGMAFKGSSIQGIGFLLTPDEAQTILNSDQRYRDVLFPYLGGEDVVRRPEGKPSRWVINFFDWSLEKAANYPHCLAIVKERVKPERDKIASRNSIGARRAQLWWRFDAAARDLYDAIKPLSYVWVTPEVSKYVAVMRSSTGIVFAHKVVVFPTSSHAFFAVLFSTLHSAWIETYSGTLETRLCYSVADGFETFPFPRSELVTRDVKALPWPHEHLRKLEMLGERYAACRESLMLNRQSGLTDTYNRFHDRNEQSEDIARLRALHVEMDQAVAAAYGWSDLDLGHDFHPTKQGERFTLSESARRTILDRLLALNHQRHEEEVKAGLHEKRKAKGAKKAVKPADVPDVPDLGLDFMSLPKEDRWAAIGRPRPKVKEPLLYACALIEALLSKNDGKLWMEDLQEVFLKVVTPMRLLRDTPSTLKPTVERWAKWWSATEKAQNLHFRPALEQLADEGKISAATPSRRPAGVTNPYVIQLNDGLSKPASEAVECDVSLVFEVQKPKRIPDDEAIEFTVLSSARVSSVLVAA